MCVIKAQFKHDQKMIVSHQRLPDIQNNVSSRTEESDLSVV